MKSYIIEDAKEALGTLNVYINGKGMKSHGLHKKLYLLSKENTDGQEECTSIRNTEEHERQVNKKLSECRNERLE